MEAKEAICTFEATKGNPGPIIGFAEFFENEDGTSVFVRYRVHGLTPGKHGMHVHTLGNIALKSGSSVCGHFIGDCDKCRPDDVLQEIGMIGDGSELSVNAPGGVAEGSYNDSSIRISRGINSILGRSLIIHGIYDDPNPRAAQCVIGLKNPQGNIFFSKSQHFSLL